MRFSGQLFCIFLLSAVWVAAQATQSPPDEPTPDPLDTSYQPITGKQRLDWFVRSTVGPKSLSAGIFSAALATAQNHPREYGPHWEGCGKRYGMWLTGVATGHAMEAGLGALWGEDPRYFLAEDRSFNGRVKHVVATTFAARYPDGHLAPAYARLIAIPGSNFLSNTWRADSVSNARSAGERTAWGFLGRMGSNTFAEFWPDIRKHVFRKKKE